MRVIALVDLDDTLFQTLRKCPAGIAPNALTAVGHARDGSPLSYASPRQMAFIAWLQQATWFIPVTARPLEALRRVSIGFTQAVCAHGGMIIDESGEPDPHWAAHIAQQATADAAQLTAMVRAIEATASAQGVTVAARVSAEDGIGLYVLIKQPDQDEAILNHVVDCAIGQLPPGWTDHRNGNNIALMPPWLGKAKAVAHILPGLRDRYPDATIIGFGDSLTDLPFMQLCDFAAVPRGSQLAASWGVAG